MDACLIFPSMPAVMRLNKLGSFTMEQLGQSKSAIANFMRDQKEKSGAGFQDSMLKLVRTLPKVLKYLPTDKAQDARNFIVSLQYWLGGSSENLENFLLNLAKEYVPAVANIDVGKLAEPLTPPDLGIWHPMAPEMYEDVKEYLNWYERRRDLKLSPNAPVVGLVLQRSHLVTGDEGHYSSVVRAPSPCAAPLAFASRHEPSRTEPRPPSSPPPPGDGAGGARREGDPHLCGRPGLQLAD